MKEHTTKLKEQLKWRRDKVFELSVKGFSQTEISRTLQVSEPTISRDIDFSRKEARETIKNHIQDKLPYEYNKCIKGLEEIIKEGWLIAAQADKKGDSREKLQSLALIKDTYNTKMDLLTNASLLQDSIKFVEEKQSKQKNDIPKNLGMSKDKEEGNGLEGFTEDNRDTESNNNSSYNEVF